MAFNGTIAGGTQHSAEALVSARPEKRMKAVFFALRQTGGWTVPQP
jgi:hypothetical protein